MLIIFVCPLWKQIRVCQYFNYYSISMHSCTHGVTYVWLLVGTFCAPTTVADSPVAEIIVATSVGKDNTLLATRKCKYNLPFLYSHVQPLFWAWSFPFPCPCPWACSWACSCYCSCPCPWGWLELPSGSWAGGPSPATSISYSS